MDRFLPLMSDTAGHLTKLLWFRVISFVVRFAAPSVGKEL
jgi:hypothetical protein